MNNQFIQGVTFDWDRIDNDSYLKRIEAFGGVKKLDFNKPVTFFVGENGSGKSTLLEALAVAHGFNPEGGTKNYAFSTYDTHSELCDAIRISKGYRKEKRGYFLRAESFYNVATKEEEYADLAHPFAKYHEKSHGGRVFSHWRRIICVQMVCIFLTSRKLHYPHRDSLHC